MFDPRPDTWPAVRGLVAKSTKVAFPDQRARVGIFQIRVPGVPHIVEQLEKQNGRFSALLAGVIDSAPFQRTRGDGKSMAEASRTGTSPGG